MLVRPFCFLIRNAVTCEFEWAFFKILQCQFSATNYLLSSNQFRNKIYNEFTQDFRFIKQLWPAVNCVIRYFHSRRFNHFVQYFIFIHSRAWYQTIVRETWWLWHAIGSAKYSGNSWGGRGGGGQSLSGPHTTTSVLFLSKIGAEVIAHSVANSCRLHVPIGSAIIADLMTMQCFTFLQRREK
jgi:hypothetical protein